MKTAFYFVLYLLLWSLSMWLVSYQDDQDASGKTFVLDKILDTAGQKVFIELTKSSIYLKPYGSGNRQVDRYLCSKPWY